MLPIIVLNVGDGLAPSIVNEADNIVGRGERYIYLDRLRGSAIMSNRSTGFRNGAYGKAEISPQDDVVAGSYQTWTITYTVGDLGMDDGGRLQIAYQGGDMGTPQFSEPTKYNYATVSTTGDATVEPSFDSLGYIRPWKPTVSIDVYDGCLGKGDEITVTLGDTSQGSMGQQAQTFVEDEFAFLILPDPLGTGEPIELDKVGFDIVSGPPQSLTAVAPSFADPGDTVTISVRAEDYWGNVSTDYTGTLTIASDGERDERREQVTASDGLVSAEVTISEHGVFRFTVTDEELDLVAETNPVVTETDPEDRVFWGDIHGQSEETVGTNSIQDYFDYAKNRAFLDFASHAGNDFQITDEFWNEIQETIQEFHTPEDFVTFLCYEWSANTANGGDHNVYFKGDEEEIHRSSKWLIEEGDQKHEGTYPVEELYERYEGRDDVLIIPHQGGRPSNLENIKPEMSPFIEIASAWGWFEWFGKDALARGHHVGFVGGSDDHSGRPGVSHPTNKKFFNVKGGLMAAVTGSLSREALWDAFNERSCYATTGERILLDVSIEGEPMGSTVNTDASEINVNVRVNGTNPIEQVDLFRDGEQVDSKRFGEDEGNLEKNLIELMWSGIGSKGRNKIEDWSGGLRVDEGHLSEVDQFGFDHPERGITSVGDQHVKWSGATSGNYQGIRLTIDGPPDSTLDFNTSPVSASFTVDELTEPRVIKADKFDQKLQIRPYTPSSMKDAELVLNDTDLLEGRHFYYVRVRQQGGEMAWSSPIAVTN